MVDASNRTSTAGKDAKDAKDAKNAVPYLASHPWKMRLD